MVVPIVPWTAPVAKSLSEVGSARSALIRSPATKSTVSVKAARSVDSLASEASCPLFRPSLTKTSVSRVRWVLPAKSPAKSSSEGGSGAASGALITQSDCVESATKQTGVLGVCPKSKSGLMTKSKSGFGRQAAGPKVLLAGVKKLSSPGSPLAGSPSASSE